MDISVIVKPVYYDFLDGALQWSPRYLNFCSFNFNLTLCKAAFCDLLNLLSRKNSNREIDTVQFGPSNYILCVTNSTFLLYEK